MASSRRFWNGMNARCRLPNAEGHHFGGGASLLNINAMTGGADAFVHAHGCKGNPCVSCPGTLCCCRKTLVKKAVHGIFLWKDNSYHQMRGGDRNAWKSASENGKRNGWMLSAGMTA